MLRFQLKNVIFTPATIVSILGLYLFMIVSLYPSPHPDIMYNYQYSIAIGYGSIFIPVAAAIPVSFFLHQVGSYHNSQFTLIRSSIFSYIGATIFITVISGVIVTVGAFLLFTLTCFLYSPAGTPYIGAGMFQDQAYIKSFYGNLTTHPLVLYGIMGLIYTLNGAVWPMISLLCYSFSTNQYLIVSIPFIVSIVLGYASQMLELHYLDPGQLMLFGGVAADLPFGGIPYAVSYIGIIVLLCGGIWAMRTYKKVHYA